MKIIDNKTDMQLLTQADLILEASQDNDLTDFVVGMNVGKLIILNLLGYFTINEFENLKTSLLDK